MFGLNKFPAFGKKKSVEVVAAVSPEERATLAQELEVLKKSHEEIREFQDAGQGAGKDDAMRLEKIESRIKDIEKKLGKS